MQQRVAATVEAIQGLIRKGIPAARQAMKILRSGKYRQQGGLKNDPCLAAGNDALFDGEESVAPAFMEGWTPLQHS
jgi:hypothetical protein